MQKWVKWALVAGGALVLVKVLQGQGLLPDTGSKADAPGVEPGDVTYARYRDEWSKARAKGAEKFNLKGVIQRSDGDGAFFWRYFWLTPSGQFDHKVHGGR